MTPAELAALARVRSFCTSGAARAIRQVNNLSLREVAEVAGVGASTVYRWEMSQRQPRGEPALRYASLLAELTRGAR